MISIVACCHSAKLCVHAARVSDRSNTVYKSEIKNILWNLTEREGSDT